MISEKMRRGEDKPLEPKPDSELLSEQVKEFVRNGGAITFEPMGKTAKFGQRLSKSNKRAMNQNG